MQENRDSDPSPAIQNPLNSEDGASLKGKTGLRRIWNALHYSIDGLKGAYTGEAAFRQEVWLALFLIAAAMFLRVSGIGRALLIGSVLLVLIVELINSAIEAAIDRIGLEKHPLSKRAKDIGSAAVLIALVDVFAVWASILPEALQ